MAGEKNINSAYQVAGRGGVPVRQDCVAEKWASPIVGEACGKLKR
jgi:hypothetical protein